MPVFIVKLGGKSITPDDSGDKGCVPQGVAREWDCPFCPSLVGGYVRMGFNPV